MEGEVSVNKAESVAEKSKDDQYDSAGQLRGETTSLGQTGLHFGSQSPARRKDTLLPALPLGPPL